MIRDNIYQLIDFAGNLLCGNSLYISSLNRFFIHGITDEFFQFFLDIFHICTCFLDKTLICSLRNILSLFTYTPNNPFSQHIFLWCSKLHCRTNLICCLENLCFFFYFIFDKYKISCLWNVFKILCQSICILFKQLTVLYQNQTSLRKKRHRICRNNQIFYIKIRALIRCDIHCIIWVYDSLFQFIAVLADEITFFSI